MLAVMRKTMIIIDEPVDGAFHEKRLAEETAAADRLPGSLERSLHLELAALHRLALVRSVSATSRR
jgi:hypothetical protein